MVLILTNLNNCKERTVLSTYALANSPLVSDLIGSLPPKPQSDTFITDKTKTLHPGKALQVNGS